MKNGERTHNARIKRRWIDPNVFKYFWELISDKDPEFCAICGFYIPVSLRTPEHSERTSKDADLVHIDCFNQHVKYNDIFKRITEETLLICSFESIDHNWIGEYNYLTDFRLKICRAKVFNNANDLLDHLIKTHGFNSNYRNDWQRIRYNYFLKPNCKSFSEPKR